MSKITVGVMFGGRSAEHEISLLSAYNIITTIPKKKYEVVPIGVKKDGSFVFYQRGEFILDPQNAKRVRLNSGGIPVTFTFGTDGRMVSLKGMRVNKKLDVIFPVLHGTFGEDGTTQGLLSLANIPCVGPGVEASAIGMDKDVTKRLWRDAGLPIADFLFIRSGLFCNS